MKRKYFTFFALLLILACKTNKETENNSADELDEGKSGMIQSKKTFESSILDLRSVNKKFNDQYGVEKFGMLKNNDSIYSFVFKLDKNTTSNVVESYSIGIRIFDVKLSTPLNLSFNPEIEYIEGYNYLIMSNNLKGMKYFDSLDVYIYKRKDWNSSGRLGEIKIKDILIE